MLRIRLLRRGKKGQPFFSIIAIDSRRSNKSKKFIRELGYYNPICKSENERVKINDLSIIENLINNGAKSSITVENILKKYKKMNRA
ncbi:MAG TPA: 30S ribosomal protein S16 [Mycoplasmatales bacterium]|jgi:small subunit ribosomal protein S16|nr:30S ribosomal protein S16 [Mycoplasmatales bacterium]